MPCEEIVVAGRSEEIVVVKSSGIVERKQTLLRDRFVQFKLAHLDVQPVRSHKIVEARPRLRNR